jgi:hypothetical protein
LYLPLAVLEEDMETQQEQQEVAVVLVVAVGSVKQHLIQAVAAQHQHLRLVKEAQVGRVILDHLVAEEGLAGLEVTLLVERQVQVVQVFKAHRMPLLMVVQALAEHLLLDTFLAAGVAEQKLHCQEQAGPVVLAAAGVEQQDHHIPQRLLENQTLVGVGVGVKLIIMPLHLAAQVSSSSK